MTLYPTKYTYLSPIQPKLYLEIIVNILGLRQLIPPPALLQAKNREKVITPFYSSDIYTQLNHVSSPPSNFKCNHNNIYQAITDPENEPIQIPTTCDISMEDVVGEVEIEEVRNSENEDIEREGSPITQVESDLESNPEGDDSAFPLIDNRKQMTNSAPPKPDSPARKGRVLANGNTATVPYALNKALSHNVLDPQMSQPPPHLPNLQ
jgi:hypothetical protein